MAAAQIPGTAFYLLKKDSTEMAELSFVHTGPGSKLQCDAIPMLAVCFDEFVEFQKRFGNRFPFVEESFIALCGQQIIGHAGLMPMRVHGNDGEICERIRNRFCVQALSQKV